MSLSCERCDKGKTAKRITVCVDCPSRRLDDPWSDGTDLAHPAFWRGEQNGVRGAVMRIREILDGKDDGRGVIGNPGLEQLRRDLMARLK